MTYDKKLPRKNLKCFLSIILTRCTPLTYWVKTHSGLTWRHHVDYLLHAVTITQYQYKL